MPHFYPLPWGWGEQEPHGEPVVLTSAEVGPSLPEPGSLKQTPPPPSPPCPAQDPPRVHALITPGCAGALGHSNHLQLEDFRPKPPYR